MNKKFFAIISVFVLIFAIGVVLCYNIFSQDNAELLQDKETETNEINEEYITQIPLDSVKGITVQEAENLCRFVLGEKDEKTGFTFSFGVSAAVRKNNKQYYVVRTSWLVNNSHLSYIGDFFVSADGKEIYSGTAISGEYVMTDKIWSE